MANLKLAVPGVLANPAVKVASQWLAEIVMPGAPQDASEVVISRLAYDNRCVTAGSLFFCVAGLSRDGHDSLLTQLLTERRPLSLR